MNTNPEYKGCPPGRGCFTCPYEDCIRPLSSGAYNTTHEETVLRAAGLQEKVGKKTPYGSLCLVICGK